jgi:hypothetical protein
MENVPKLALNACVFNPAVGSAPAGAYAANAPNEGVSVPAKERKKAPYAEKTTEGKVLPRIHSRRPERTRSNPPKK